jgi:hypothetical protein
MHFNRMWVGRSMYVGSLLLASIAVSACGSSSPAAKTGSTPATTTGRILDTHKVEQAIERSALAQRGEHAQVTCPTGVHQANGLVFSCTAVVGRASTRFIVTELDGSGHVHYVAR